MTDAMMHDLESEAPGSAALRVAVVAPCEGRGGAGTAHSTRIARHLADAGHEVTLLLWGHQQTLAADARERSASVRTISALQRARPGSWVQAGRRLRGFDSIIVVHSGPFEVAAHLCLLRAAGALPGRAGVLRSRPRSIVVDLAPRSLPSPSRPVPTGVAGPLLMACDSVLVHDDAQAVLARRLGARRISLVGLPASAAADAADSTDVASLAPPAWHEVGPRPVRLLLLRPARNRPEAERLLRAIRSVPGITLTIAAGAAGSDRHLTSAIAEDPALAARVVVREGRVRDQTLARLLAEHDVLVVPPTAAPDDDGGDAAQGHPGDDVALAHAHGLAALAPDVAPFSKQVTDGVDGLLVARGSETALAEALRRLREPPLRDRLGLGLSHCSLNTQWAHYLGALEALSVDTSSLPDDLGPVDPADSFSALASLRRSMHEHAPWVERTRRVAKGFTSTVTTRATRRGVVDLSTSAILDAVSATDVLVAADELGAVPDPLRQARSLGLPRARDQACAWAALGALAAIVRVCEDGGRGAVVGDEGGPRSVFSRWVSAAGLMPAPLAFTGIRPRGAALEADDGSLDAVVRIHPSGCDATDVDQVLEQASWALRRRGLLIVTVPIGPPGADGALAPADVRGIVARALDLGFVLVGDLDGPLTAQMRQAATRARADDAAYGLVRLTLRRR